MIRRSLAVLPLVVALAVGLAGCSSGAEPVPSETPLETSTPTPEPTPTAIARTFTMPADCVDMLPESRRQAFATEGLDLLGGPGGVYENYYADPTPEEQVGGISCIWGDDDVPESTITVSVAPLTAATRASTIDSLIAQGLNEAVVDDGVTYALLGDENSAPAILNIVRPHSWISVIQALGGEAFFTEAVEIADEVADEVYR